MTTIGFGGLHWKTASTAEQMATNRVEEAVVNVLTPICVERFRQDADFRTKLAELKDAPIWARYQVIEKGGWATVPGGDETHPAVARACAAKISEMA
jgi:hypothetical protein